MKRRGDDADIILTATVWEADPEYWCPLLRAVTLTPSSSAPLLLAWESDKRRENRAQSMWWNEKKKVDNRVLSGPDVI